MNARSSDPLATESTFSFPSGHALVSLAVYGSIALVVSRRLPRRRDRILLLAATGLLVLAIGFSRLYLGVHFLSDVLAGTPPASPGSLRSTWCRVRSRWYPVR